MSRKYQDKIAGVLQGLSPADQEAVLNFAEFLLSRAPTPAAIPAARVEIPEPEPCPRPQDEKVVAAIKRLSKVYYMLDKNKMLGVTSDLMTQHVLQGRDAVEVIDELEQVFAGHYRQLKQGDDV